MDHLYGTFTAKQIADHKKALHNSIHWLLIYKENGYEDLDRYIFNLIVRISGLNDLLMNPPVIVSLLSILQALREENQKPDCDKKLYRKLVFDAHSIVDKIKEE